MTKAKPWSEADSLKLVKLAGTMGTKAIAKTLKRTPMAVSIQACKLGVSLQFQYVSSPWTNAELSVIHHGLRSDVPVADIVVSLTRHTVGAATQRCNTEAKKLGLTGRVRALAKGFLREEDHVLIKNLYPFITANEIHAVLTMRGRTISINAVQQAAYRLGLDKAKTVAPYTQ